MNTIRIKAYIYILPLIVAVSAVGGFLSVFETRTALSRLSNRHLTYKAEQLRDFINNEWQMVESLNLTDTETYRDAERESFVTYAYSILRSETESVFIFDASGALVRRVGGTGGFGPELGRLGASVWPPLAIGWFERSLFGENRVGIAFRFEPFGWTIAVSELHSRYFGDINTILRDHFVVLIGAIILTALLLAVYLRVIISPLERLSASIGTLISTRDFSRRLPSGNRDEIGAVSDRFNELLVKVEEQRRDLVSSAAMEREANEVSRQRESETLFLLGRISEYNDEETGAHLVRIGRLSAVFSRLLGQDEGMQDLIEKSAPLHDLGKIRVPQSILQKPAKLTPDEFEIMKLHSEYGYELLKDCKSRYLLEGAEIAWTHHERWDGEGYPRGLKGEDIPLSGRIVSIVDVYDALVSVRPYKEPWTNERALAYIQEERGLRFDPRLVDLFTGHLSLFLQSPTFPEYGNDQTTG